MRPGSKNNRTAKLRSGRCLAVEAFESRVMPFSNGFSGLSAAPNQEDITSAALSFLKPEVLDAIIGGPDYAYNGGATAGTDSNGNPVITGQGDASKLYVGNVGMGVQDLLTEFPGAGPTTYAPAHEFDNSAFAEGVQSITDTYTQFVAATKAGGNPYAGDGTGSLTDLFGRITHTAQDYYTSSNWVDSGKTTLVDAGTGNWAALTPFTVVHGMYVIEGTKLPAGVTVTPDGYTPDPTTHVPVGTPTGFKVTVTLPNHTTVPGLISGTIVGQPDNAPAAVAVIRGNIPYSFDQEVDKGLNKDDAAVFDGALFPTASGLAVQQTTHEFVRLLNLVYKGNGGGTAGAAAVNDLICHWVRADMLGYVQSILDKAGVGGITGGGGDMIIPIATSTPVPIPLGTVHAGDTFPLIATLTTTDPNEDGEGEPLVIKSSKGFSLTINTYAQPQQFVFKATADGETLSAYVVNADGDHAGYIQMPCDNGRLPAADVPFTQDDFAELNALSSQLNLDAAFAAAVGVHNGVTLSVTPTATGLTETVSPGTTAAAAGSGGFEVEAGLDWALANAINQLQFATVDPYYRQVVQPAPASVTLATSNVGAAPGVVAAFNGLYANLTQATALATALVTSIERAGGATVGGDPADHLLQVQAVRLYASQLGTLLAAQPTLRAALKDEMIAAGFIQTLSSSAINSAASGYAADGLPAPVTQLLQAAGAGPGDLFNVTEVAIAQGTAKASGTTTEKAADPQLATLLQQSAAVMADSIPPADLAVSIAAPAQVPDGTAVTLTVSVTDLGPAAATSVVLTVPLPAGETFSSAAPGQGTYTLQGNTLTVAIGAIPTGATVVVPVVVTTTSDAAFVNTAKVSGTEFDPQPTNSSAAATVAVGNAPPPAPPTVPPPPAVPPVLPPVMPPPVPPVGPPTTPPTVPPTIPPSVPPTVPPSVPPNTPPDVPSSARVLVGYSQFAAGSDAGGSTVTLYNSDKSVRYTVTPFPGFTGGLRVAAADFNGDGVADLAVGTGPGGPSQVEILDGVDQHVLLTLAPFEASFTGGVYLAAGDVNGDGVPELVVTPDEGGGPRVEVYDGKTFAKVADFYGIDDPNFRGGARAAVGDVNGDGVGDLVVAAGFQGGPRVAGFDGKSLMTGAPVKIFADFFAFEQTLRNGVFLAVGDVNGDGHADVIVGGGPGGGPRVTVFDGAALLANQYTAVVDFFAGDPANRGGVRVAVKNLDGDTKADLVVGSGTGAGSAVTAYLGTGLTGGNPTAAFDYDGFPGFTGGVFVG